jgi:hypothetical protein
MAEWRAAEFTICRNMVESLQVTDKCGDELRENNRTTSRSRPTSIKVSSELVRVAIDSTSLWTS